ncbi:MAG: phage holin family protein [bacterium]|nr:phage holin family protein [bacterium]
MAPASGDPAPPSDGAGADAAEAPPEPAEALADLRETVLAYLRQEAVDPLKRLAAWLGFGLLGGVFVCTGLVLLALGGLRALQTETGGHLSGNLSWAPYGIVLAAVLVVFLFARAGARARRRGSPEEER